jgi:hypothetical protein
MSNKHRYEPSDYMHWVTDNVDTFVKGEQNLVACVYCIEIYETSVFKAYHNCLFCDKCDVDALMVVKHSPLLEMSDEDRMKKLEEWHKKGFTPIPKTAK